MEYRGIRFVDWDCQPSPNVDYSSNFLEWDKYPEGVKQHLVWDPMPYSNKKFPKDFAYGDKLGYWNLDGVYVSY